ncbi:uncharacterized protein MICPUCDRAFT_65064 [Micromonas pusilla CCMP1545]|uniref:Predicted protein n=1 Tax=Micromonas pusilla (strain CCMP1545) TaxID=564608 RepID=C1MLI8_MICPC|nr:uncharacterized protein MICPUCDRAFT_65064 [Micromonas pusilla CCMP1545]EEH59949.1 predicted protein [Micromonas pusilla CCMP1545]|eukprot:XP_003056573.1 predicted protein [Micromonas pusilla CCMP1545]
MKKSENLIEYEGTKVHCTFVPSYEGTKVPSTCTVTCTAVLVLYSQMYVVLPEVRKYYEGISVRKYVYRLIRVLPEVPSYQFYFRTLSYLLSYLLPSVSYCTDGHEVHVHVGRAVAGLHAHVHVL